MIGEGKNFYPFLTGIRDIAAWLVFIGHLKIPITTWFFYNMKINLSIAILSIFLASKSNRALFEKAFVFIFQCSAILCAFIPI